MYAPIFFFRSLDLSFGASLTRIAASAATGLMGVEIANFWLMLVRTVLVVSLSASKNPARSSFPKQESSATFPPVNQSPHVQTASPGMRLFLRVKRI